MSLKAKLLLLVTLSIGASVGAVAWLIEERAHEAFRQVEQERTKGLVHQFQREFDHEGEEISRAVDIIANSDSMLRTVIDLSNGADYANHGERKRRDVRHHHCDPIAFLHPELALQVSREVARQSIGVGISQRLAKAAKRRLVGIAPHRAFEQLEH